jgi:hypothetical protein
MTMRHLFLRGAARALGWPGGVERSGGLDEGFECLFVERLALAQIDGAAGVAVEAGVEEAGRVVQRSALRKGQLHDGLVGLARADDPGLLPHRNPTPLHRLDHIGQSLPDQRPNPRQRLTTPVVQVLDMRVDLLGGGGWVLLRGGLRLHGS